MKQRKIILQVFCAGLLAGITSCNLPAASPTAVETWTPSATVQPLGTNTAELPAAATIPVETVSPVPVPTAQDPLVAYAALCWWGPGPIYEVISSLKQDIRVKLAGKGSIPGWYLVDNPIYHVPCWVQDDYLQIDPNTDLSTLPIFTPPPTPTPTVTQTRTPTPTLTPVP